MLKHNIFLDVTEIYYNFATSTGEFIIKDVNMLD